MLTLCSISVHVLSHNTESFSIRCSMLVITVACMAVSFFIISLVIILPSILQLMGSIFSDAPVVLMWLIISVVRLLSLQMAFIISSRIFPSFKSSCAVCFFVHVASEITAITSISLNDVFIFSSVKYLIQCYYQVRPHAADNPHYAA